MRNRQISQPRQINNTEYKNSPNSIKQKIAQSTQISARGSLIKPCLKKLNSSIFLKGSPNQNDPENLFKSIDEQNEIKTISKVTQLFQVRNTSNELSKRQSRLMNANTLSTNYTTNLNNSNNISRTSIIQMISRYRSVTQEDERRKGGDSPTKRDSPTSPNKKRLTFLNTSVQLNSSPSVTFLTASQTQPDERKKVNKLKRSLTHQSVDTNKSSIRNSIAIPKEKKEQCKLIKNAFQLLPNKRFLPIDDDKGITIRTPISSSDSSSSSLDTSFPQYKQPNPLLNDSSKQFLKTFIKERRMEDKLLNCRSKSNEVRQIQQTILNKVLNETNKEKERQQIIKNFENVKFLQKNKKQQTSTDFDPLVHYRPKDNFCKNKNVIVKLNKGFHPPKDTSAIARDQQEEYKNFIIPCQKSNFFGSEARRMLNRGVPQIIQNLQSIKY